MTSPISGNGIFYDATTVSRILGFSCESSEPVPETEDGKVDIYYDGWTLGELVSTGKVVNHLSKEQEKWSASAGYYRILMPVPGGNQITHDGRIAHLHRLYATFTELPTPVGAMALAMHLGVTGEDPLKGGYCICAETVPHDVLVGLRVRDGRVVVGSLCRRVHDDNVFLGAAKKVRMLKS